MRSRILYLVGLDRTEAAVTWQVAELSKAWQAPVVLLGVEPTHWLAFVARERQRALKRRLLDVARRLRALRGHVAGVKVASGDACTIAQRTADQVGAELVITGAGERAIADSVALSDTAFAIARNARQDVWICKPAADPHVEHVLCAADTSALAGDAVRRSVDLCRRFNARLRVVSVLAEPAGADDPDAAALAARAEQRAFLERFDLRGVALSRAILWSAQAPVEVLLEAERYPDGLLVMGAASALGARGLGATAEPVLRACPSSILLVRRRLAARTADAGTALAITYTADGGRDPDAAPTSPPSR